MQNMNAVVQTEFFMTPREYKEEVDQKMFIKTLEKYPILVDQENRLPD